MTTRRVALLVVALVAVALGGTAAFVATSSSGSSSSSTATTWERDIPAPTFDGPLATFQEGETRDAEGNISTGELPVFTHRSARLEDLTAPVIVRPTGIAIPGIQLIAPVLPVGVKDDLQLDVPPDAGSVVWYEHGSTPGGRGSSVLAGHVDYDGVAGAFYDLRWLELGERFQVTYEDGTSRPFEVVGSKQFDKTNLPTSELFTDDGDPTVVLITCGGEFDEGQRSYSDNLVVYATPAGQDTET
ncbi:hypothetical protein BH18ACT1_BH18ACT1_12880 [soil metagenome]|nr:class F sortase [Acidimicrobiia bacterium]